jgi:hypothetical protein
MNCLVKSNPPDDESGVLAVVRMTSRQGVLSLAKTFLACAAMAIATGAAVQAQRFLARATQQVNTPADNAQTERQLTDTAELQGPFSLGDQQYTVLLRKKVLRDATAASTLVGLDILDAHRNAVYQETFPYALADGRFSHIVTLSTSLLSGRGGSALVIRFIEQAAAMPGIEGPPWKESWQVFGMVNGRLTAFGAVLPLGQGADITVGGVVAGVMVKGGIAVVPLASTAEALEFRAWTGNFYAFVPVRVDWVHGQWGEGEQCYELAGGTPRAKGCSMRAEAQRTPRPGSADILFVRLFATADGNTYNSQDVAVRDDSQVDFLNVLAMVHWGANGNRVECSFDNVWLRTRIDGKEGWVNGEEAFEALGLPRESPK